MKGAELNGRWRLVYTSGTKKVAANLNRAGFGGSYFPLPAVQSFDMDAGRIRNGVYLGPVKFFFDGPFVWRERLNMLEFTFTRVSLGLGPLGPWSVDIDDGKWDAVKEAEQTASSGQGKIERGAGSQPGANPFFNSCTRTKSASRRGVAGAGSRCGRARVSRRQTRPRESDARIAPATICAATSSRARARLKSSQQLHFDNHIFFAVDFISRRAPPPTRAIPRLARASRRRHAGRGVRVDMSSRGSAPRSILLSPGVDGDDEAAELGTTRDAVVTCRVCHRAYAKYTCPRCFTRYCALACYKAHDSRCVQSFHGENLGDAMRGLTVEDEDKRRMTEILAKYADREPDGGDERPLDEPLPLDEHAHDAHDEHDEHDDDDEDDERGTCVLSEANLEKLSRGLDLTPADLDPRERAAFERAAATGELSHMVEAWTPWWTRPESCDITLARDGTKIIRELAAHTSDTFEPPGSSRDAAAADETASSSASPPSPPEEPLPANLAAHVGSPITRAPLAPPRRPRRVHADHARARWGLARGSRRRRVGVARALPDVVRGRVVRPDRSSLPETAAAAMHGVAERAATSTSGVMAAAAAAAAVGAAARDARDVLLGGRGATVVALEDARRVVAAAAEATAEGAVRDGRARGGGRNARGTFARVERKLFFMACWANAAAEEDGTLELLASWAAREAARGEPPPAKSRARNTSRGRSWRRRDARAGEGANAVRGGSDGSHQAVAFGGTNEAATRVSPSQKNARRRAWQVCASHSVVEMRSDSRLCWDGSDVDHVAALTRMQIQ